MKTKKAIFTLLVLFAICHVQAITISGVVKISGGSGLEGVKVRLGKANIATTTAADGSFTLTENITGAKHQPRHTALGNSSVQALCAQ